LKNKTNIYFIIGGLIGFFILWISESIIISIVSEEDFTSGMISKLYPSFQEKLEDIGVIGIGAICSQLKYRWLYLISFFYFLFRFQNSPDRNSIDNNSILWRIRMFYVVQLVFLPELLQELRVRGQWKALFQPLAQFSFIDTFPLEYYIQLTGILLFGATAILVLAKWKEKEIMPLLLTIFIFLTWTFLLSLFFGFGKIDHTYASLFAGIMGMVVCRISIFQNTDNATQGYRIFQAFIWSCYFFSGLEKISMSGFDWFQENHFEIICKFHATDLCVAISSNPISGSIIMLAGISFQLLSPLQWRFPKWGYVNVLGGLVFHLGTWLLFNIGGWQSPWIIMLIFLWPSSKPKNSEIIKLVKSTKNQG